MARSCASSEPSKSMAAQADNTTVASSLSPAASMADHATQKSVASQVFLAALMVSYTVFGLWLLSTPAIA